MGDLQKRQVAMYFLSKLDSKEQCDDDALFCRAFKYAGSS